MPQVSVIMPAYNSRSYLGPSIESVRQQQGVSWELLLVDDGSKDGTLDLARQYASLDQRIRVMRNTGQKGPGGPRNTGLRAAKGQAVIFLDSDDLLYPDALRALWEGLNKTGLPVVRGQGIKFCHQRWLTFVQNTRQNSGDIILEEARYPRHSFCYHLYDAGFLSRHGIVFAEDLIVGEDTTFLCHVYALLSEVPVVNRPVHLYRINHKPANPSAAKSLAAATRTVRSRKLFEEQGKGELVVPYLEHIFFPEWLERLHSARAEGDSRAKELLGQWLPLFSGLTKPLGPVVQKQLGPLTAPFLAACQKEEIADMLDILTGSGRIKPPGHYMGIARAASGPAWHGYKFLCRLRDLFRSRQTRSVLLYLARMRLRSRASLTSFPARGKDSATSKEV